MSEEAAVVAPAPSAAPEPAVLPPDGVGATTPPPNAREALQRAADRAKGIEPVAPAAPAPDATIDATRPRDEKGQFVAKEAPIEGATTEGAVTPPETVRVPVPEGHFLRDKGYETLPFDIPSEFEGAMKGVLNNDIRRKQLDAAVAENQRLQSELLEHQTRQKWMSENPATLTPEMQVLIDDMGADGRWTPEQVEHVRQRLLSESQAEADVAVQQELQKHSEAQMVQTAQEFRIRAMTDAFQRYPGWGPEAQNLILLQQSGRNLDGTPPPGSLAAAMTEYGVMVQMKVHQDPNYKLNAADWYAVADKVYAATPAGQSQAQAQAAAAVTGQATAAEAAKAAELETMTAATQAAAVNPLGSVPRLQSHLTSPSAQRDAPRNAKEAIKRAHDRAKGM